MKSQKPTVVTRFAPSPSGKLQVGGARTALLNFIMAKRCGGQFILRIEDIDKDRVVEGSAGSIIEDLSWLGIDWDEFFVQSNRTGIYQYHANQLFGQEKAYWKGGSIWFRMPQGPWEVEDEVYGNITVKAPRKPEDADFMLMHSDGTPTYDLTNTVDDAIMGTTLVMRGREFLGQTPRHMELYKTLGYEPPRYAHLPTIVDFRGHPISKRDGSVAIEDFRRMGYVPEALINALVLSGWSPGDKDLLDFEEMLNCFEVSRIRRSDSVFDRRRLVRLNTGHMRKLPHDRLLYLFKIFLGRQPDHNPLKKETDDVLSECLRICANSRSLLQVAEKCWPLYKRQLLPARDARLLRSLKHKLTRITDWNQENIKLALKEYDLKEATAVLRSALCGQDIAPPLMDVMRILGQREVLDRIVQTLLEF